MLSRFALAALAVAALPGALCAEPLAIRPGHRQPRPCRKRHGACGCRCN